jgi:hypothetical protein
MGIGQPGVHRHETSFCSEADENQQKSHPHQIGRETRPMARNPCHV